MDNNKNMAIEATRGLALVDRRFFLKTTLAAAGAMAASGCANGLLGRSGKKDELAADGPAEDVVLQGTPLSERERAVFVKLIEVMLPAGEADLLGTDTVPVLENCDSMIRTLPAQVRTRLWQGIEAFDVGAIVLSFQFRRFSSLDKDQALAYVLAWHEGSFPQRGVITSLKSIVCVNYWRDQRAAALVGYDGPVTEKWGIRRLGNQPLPRA
jgi:hypothetical protein